MPIFFSDNIQVQSSLTASVVLISGSLNTVSSIRPLQNITGSIFGTASVALNATASFITASNIQGIITSSNAITGSLSNLANQAEYSTPAVFKLFSLLGSRAVAGTLNFTNNHINTAGNGLTANLLYLAATYIPTTTTLTGCLWFRSNTPVTAGGTGCNSVGLYSYSGGTLTLVASSSNDSNMWLQGSALTFLSKSFTSTYTANRGTYFIAAEANYIGTVPQLPNITTGVNTLISTYDFTNSAKVMGTITNNNSTLPSSIAMSTVTAVGNTNIFLLY